MTGMSVCIAAQSPADAASHFDGVYQVAITTERGSCDSTAWKVAISDGQIADHGFFVQSAGHVDANGHVVLRVTRGADVLAAAGAISGLTGSGTWAAPSRQCSGRWHAIRS
jgi:hypothetical protein